jgi:ceroid-lipofuscinosis protein 8
MSFVRVYIAAYVAFFDGRIALDHVIASTDESWAFISVITGFFIFEEVTLIYFDIKYRTFSKELHMHHFFAFNGFFLAALYNRGHYYAAKAFVLEASTPFSCLCWCLLKLKLEKTKAWKINQWILIYVFHLRSVYEIWWWYDIVHDWDNIKQNLPWLYTVNMLMGLSIVSFWLTPYWTYKKTVQFFNPVDWNTENEKRKRQAEIDKTS